MDYVAKCRSSFPRAQKCRARATFRGFLGGRSCGAFPTSPSPASPGPAQNGEVLRRGSALNAGMEDDAGMEDAGMLLKETAGAWAPPRASSLSVLYGEEPSRMGG